MSAPSDKSKAKKNRNRRKPKDVPKEEAASASGEENAEVNSAEQFEFELTWCIQQLTLSLGQSSQKITHKQGAQAVEALRSLSNPKTPFIKKRQLMRVHCGDYRKKMAQEEKQYTANQKEASIVQSKPSEKSVLVRRRKVPGSSDITQDPTSTTKDNETTQENKGSGFCFNFKVDGDDKQQQDGSTEPSKQDSSKAQESKSEASKVQESKSEAPVPTSNSFKMVPSNNNDFRFNFKIDP